MSALILASENATASDTAELMASRLAALEAPNVQTIPASPQGPIDVRWIAWDDGFGSRQAVTLALCKSAGCTWRQDWPGAYEPTIQYVGAWSAAGQPVFLLLFSEGAEAQTAIILSRRRDGVPVILDRLDAAAIAFSPRVGGLEVDVSSGLPEQWKCEGWDRSRQHLAPMRCR